MFRLVDVQRDSGFEDEGNCCNQATISETCGNRARNQICVVDVSEAMQSDVRPALHIGPAHLAESKIDARHNELQIN